MKEGDSPQKTQMRTQKKYKGYFVLFVHLFVNFGVNQLEEKT
jgi:hypothetical protein